MALYLVYIDKNEKYGTIFRLKNNCTAIHIMSIEAPKPTRDSVSATIRLDRETFKPKELPPAISEAIENGARISAELLQQNQCVQIELRGGRKTYIRTEMLELMRSKAAEFLRKYNGYIPTQEYERLFFASRGNEILEYNDFVSIQKQIKSFQEAQLPLFPAGLHSFIEEEQEWFPGIEFPILWATNTITARQIEYRNQTQDIQKRDAIYKVIDIGLVKKFQDIAFTADGTLDPQLCNDIIARISAQWTFKNAQTKQHVINKFRAEILPHIEKVCSTERTAAYTELSEPFNAFEIIKNARWYLSYDMETRQKIVDAYVQPFQYQRAKTAEQNTFRKLCALFPDLEATVPYGDLVFWFESTQIQNNINKKIFTWLNPTIIADDRYSEHVAQGIAYIQTQLQLCDNEKLFGNITTILSNLRLVHALAQNAQVQEAINKLRIQRLEQMDDQTFTAKVIPLKINWEIMSAKNLIDYVEARLAKIQQAPTP